MSLGRFFKEIAPKMAGAGGNSGLGPLSIAQLVTDVAGPLGYQMGITAPGMKRAREAQNVKLNIPELMAGVVRDMPRPNFGLPSRSPVGSSLAEQNMGKLFRDAFQRQQEGAFEVQNEASKIAQENQVLERTNRNTAMQANVKNQEVMANAGMAHRELLGWLQDQGTNFESVFGNVSQDLGQLSYLTEAQKIAKAAEIVRNPDVYDEDSEEYKRALAIMRSGLAKRGKKLKTKFST